jgi:hypothetical protein
MKINNEKEAKEYWEGAYNPEFQKELRDRWTEIQDILVQPENLHANLELRNTVALEKIAHYLEQISEEGLLVYNGENYHNPKKEETTKT